MCMFSGTTYGWPPMVTAFASGFGIASEYLISVYRLSSGTRYPPSTYDFNSAPPSVCQVSGGRLADSRACRTTRWLTPPPPATGFSTSWMSGYFAFNALNMASAASRSPPAVHQWKISSLRSSAFAIPPPRCVPAQYPATPATSAAMTTPTTIWETGAFVAPLLMPIPPPWEMKPAYAIAVKGRSDDFGVGAGASCQARRRHVPARVVRGSRTGPTRSGGEAFLDDHETFRAPRMRRPSTHVERLERPQLRGKNRSACGLSRPRVFGHRTEHGLHSGRTPVQDREHDGVSTHREQGGCLHHAGLRARMQRRLRAAILEQAPDQVQLDPAEPPPQRHETVPCGQRRRGFQKPHQVGCPIRPERLYRRIVGHVRRTGWQGSLDHHAPERRLVPRTLSHRLSRVLVRRDGGACHCGPITPGHRIALFHQLHGNAAAPHIGMHTEIFKPRFAAADQADVKTAHHTTVILGDQVMPGLLAPLVPFFRTGGTPADDAGELGAAGRGGANDDRHGGNLRKRGNEERRQPGHLVSRFRACAVPRFRAAGTPAHVAEHGRPRQHDKQGGGPAGESDAGLARHAARFHDTHHHVTAVQRVDRKQIREAQADVHGTGQPGNGPGTLRRGLDQGRQGTREPGEADAPAVRRDLHRMASERQHQQQSGSDIGQGAGQQHRDPAAWRGLLWNPPR